MRIKVIAAFIKKELRQSLRDKRMRVLLFLAPVIQMTLFGLALRNEVRNIRLAVYAAPDDRVAWDLARRAEGTRWFHLVPAESGDPMNMLRKGQVDAALIAPPGGLTRAVERGQGSAQLLVDAANTVRSQGVVNYFEIVRQQEQAKRYGRLSGPRLEVISRVLYNPTMESRFFMVPGVLAMLLVLVSLSLTSTSITREKERGTFETLLSSPVTRGEILLGKAVPYIMLSLFAQLPLVIMVARFGFNVPMRGELWELALAAACFIICNVSLGILISTYAQNQQQAMMGTFLILYPAQMLSGIIYPLDNMPDWLYGVTYLNPLRYFAVLIRNIMLKGGSPELFWPNIAGLAALSTLLLTLAWLRFKPTLN